MLVTVEACATLSLESRELAFRERASNSLALSPKGQGPAWQI